MDLIQNENDFSCQSIASKSNFLNQVSKNDTGKVNLFAFLYSAFVEADNLIRNEIQTMGLASLQDATIENENLFNSLNSKRFSKCLEESQIIFKDSNQSMNLSLIDNSFLNESDFLKLPINFKTNVLNFVGKVKNVLEANKNMNLDSLRQENIQLFNELKFELKNKDKLAQKLIECECKLNLLMKENENLKNDLENNEYLVNENERLKNELKRFNSTYFEFLNQKNEFQKDQLLFKQGLPALYQNNKLANSFNLSQELLDENEELKKNNQKVNHYNQSDYLINNYKEDLDKKDNLLKQAIEDKNFYEKKYNENSEKLNYYIKKNESLNNLLKEYEETNLKLEEELGNRVAELEKVIRENLSLSESIKKDKTFSFVNSLKENNSDDIERMRCNSMKNDFYFTNQESTDYKNLYETDSNYGSSTIEVTCPNYEILEHKTQKLQQQIENLNTENCKLKHESKKNLIDKNNLEKIKEEFTSKINILRDQECEILCLKEQLTNQQHNLDLIDELKNKLSQKEQTLIELNDQLKNNLLLQKKEDLLKKNQEIFKLKNENINLVNTNQQLKDENIDLLQKLKNIQSEHNLNDNFENEMTNVFEIICKEKNNEIDLLTKQIARITNRLKELVPNNTGHAFNLLEDLINSYNKLKFKYDEVSVQKLNNQTSNNCKSFAQFQELKLKYDTMFDQFTKLIEKIKSPKIKNFIEQNKELKIYLENEFGYKSNDTKRCSSVKFDSNSKKLLKNSDEYLNDEDNSSLDEKSDLEFDIDLENENSEFSSDFLTYFKNRSDSLSNHNSIDENLNLDNFSSSKLINILFQKIPKIVTSEYLNENEIYKWKLDLDNFLSNNKISKYLLENILDVRKCYLDVKKQSKEKLCLTEIDKYKERIKDLMQENNILRNQIKSSKNSLQELRKIDNLNSTQNPYLNQVEYKRCLNHRKALIFQKNYLTNLLKEKNQKTTFSSLKSRFKKCVLVVCAVNRLIKLYKNFDKLERKTISKDVPSQNTLYTDNNMASTLKNNNPLHLNCLTPNMKQQNFTQFITPIVKPKSSKTSKATLLNLFQELKNVNQKLDFTEVSSFASSFECKY